MNKIPNRQAICEVLMEKAKEDTEIFDYSTGILTFADIDFSEYRKRMDNKTVTR